MRVNGSRSDSPPLTCGIPEGTIIEPIPFILYKNNVLHRLVNSHPRLYADSTQLTFASNDITHLEENVG